MLLTFLVSRFLSIRLVRSFGDEINNPESAISKHPEDFDLYELGSFNDEDAAFICGERPRQIAIGKDVVRK